MKYSLYIGCWSKGNTSLPSAGFERYTLFFVFTPRALSTLGIEVIYISSRSPKDCRQVRSRFPCAREACCSLRRPTFSRSLEASSSADFHLAGREICPLYILGLSENVMLIFCYVLVALSIRDYPARYCGVSLVLCYTLIALMLFSELLQQ